MREVMEEIPALFVLRFAPVMKGRSLKLKILKVCETFRGCARDVWAYVYLFGVRVV